MSEQEQKPEKIESEGKLVIDEKFDEQYYKLLHKLRVCKNCPLGEKQVKIIAGDKEITKIVPAKCNFYKEDRIECALTVDEFISKMKEYKKFEKEGFDTKSMLQHLITNAVEQMELAKSSETIQKGHGTFYTKEWLDLALKYTNELDRRERGEKISKKVEVKSEQTIEMDFNEEDLKKLGDYLMELAKKRTEDKKPEINDEQNNSDSEE